MVEHDNPDGPCACGAWHSLKKSPMPGYDYEKDPECACYSQHGQEWLEQMLLTATPATAVLLNAFRGWIVNSFQEGWSQARKKLIEDKELLDWMNKHQKESGDWGPYWGIRWEFEDGADGDLRTALRRSMKG